ncbi:MAG: penicillin-binding protein 1C [Spirochaetales bacterium]|nr:penicillin-binding protein 1C [Spirochaetales bacterium]
MLFSNKWFIRTGKRVKRYVLELMDIRELRSRVIYCIKRLKRIINKKWHFAFLICLFFFLFILLLPIKQPLFEPDYSTVLKDRKGNLLCARIARDEQWRFPPVTKVPGKFRECIILFEDKNFYYHPGIDPFAIARAFCQNMEKGKTVSGASTITMQVIRLSRKGKPRIITEKILEALLALKLEFMYTKDQILALYASNLPFGGNVVGIEAASWRYFGRQPDNLSWAETALLAVLPNDPAMIHPGRNRDLLFEKRNRLLERLCEKKIITRTGCTLGKEEPLPGTPYPIPGKASHLFDRMIKDGHEGTSVISSIDPELQQLTSSIIQKHYKHLSLSKIYNTAAVIIKVDTGEALAYVGNTEPLADEEHSNSVDIIAADRSTGSILKPFLYAFMLDEGELLPGEIVPDIPLFYRGFTPKNFSKTYDGAIPADRALTRSLNIPFVYLLQKYDYRKFHRRLTQLGMTLPYPATHYSLTLILGGAESTLWDLTGMYATMARILKYYPLDGYSHADYFKNTYLLNPGNPANPEKRKRSDTSLLGAAAIWFTFSAMKEVVRPDEESNWKRYSSSKPIAWKTGTSYGNRDGWAIGITPDYVVGVWAGNADGEGRPEIKGIHVAGPILFDIFGILPHTGWFIKPWKDMVFAEVCKKSGMLASQSCEDTIIMEIPAHGLSTYPCPYHRIVHLDEKEEYQVNSSSYPVSKMVHKKWFVLPPVQEYFYKKRNSSYKVLPPDMDRADTRMEFIYPSKKNTNLYVPLELDGTPGKTVFEIAHRNPETTVFWHLDGEYLGETKTIHQMGVFPREGEHELVVVDEEGNVLTSYFTVVKRMRS